MKFIKFCLLPAFVLLLLAVGGFAWWVSSLPAEWAVERSITIRATPAEIHPHLADLQQWEEWMIWMDDAPDMELSYRGEPGAGQVCEFTDPQDNQAGSNTILTADPATGLTTRTRFGPFAFESAITYAPQGEETVVTWHSEGEAANWGEKLIGFALAEGMGEDYEKNLANLARLVESGATPK